MPTPEASGQTNTMPPNIQQALRWASQNLADNSETPRLDAEVLLAFCLQKSRSHLFSWPEFDLTATQWSEFQQLIKRRKLPTPVAYLTGNREFYSLDFDVTAAVLVPRPETELLIEQALAICERDRPQSIIDLGTGSGIIAVTIKKHFPGATMWATDRDPACLQVAADNARKLEVEIEFRLSNWYEMIPCEQQFDLILSNPPYIAADHPFLQRGDLPAEPHIALTPGVSGLESLEVIIRGAQQHLAAGGSLVVEHGYDQQQPVFELFSDCGFRDIQCLDDFNGHPRVSLGSLAN